MTTANSVDSCLLGRWVRSGAAWGRAVEDEAGVGRRSAPRRLQVEEVQRLAAAAGTTRSGAGVVARGCAEALSGEEEVAEAAGAREVGCDAGVVLDAGGVAADADVGEEGRRRAPPRLGDGRDGGTGERTAGGGCRGCVRLRLRLVTWSADGVEKGGVRDLGFSYWALVGWLGLV